MKFNKIKKIIKNILSKIFDLIGYEIVLYSKRHKHIIRNNYGLNLNIGSGDYHLTTLYIWILIQNVITKI